MIRFNPVRDLVLVEPIQDTDDKFKNIYIPHTCRDLPAEGVVVKAGPKATELNVADRVLFNRFDGTHVRIGQKTFKLFKQSEILATIL